MVLNIKVEMGSSFQLSVHPTETVKAIKQKIATALKQPVQLLYLFMNDKEVKEDDKMVKDLRMDNGQVLQVKKKELVIKKEDEKEVCNVMIMMQCVDFESLVMAFMRVMVMVVLQWFGPIMLIVLVLYDSVVVSHFLSVLFTAQSNH